jgi:hypothetical protein
MPLIKIEYDDTKIDKKDITNLSTAIQKIVSQITKIEDVFVYTNSAQIKIQIAPIEIFIEMSAHKIANIDILMIDIVDQLKQWKQENNFQIPINLSIIPMHRKIEI